MKTINEDRIKYYSYLLYSLIVAWILSFGDILGAKNLWVNLTVSVLILISFGVTVYALSKLKTLGIGNENLDASFKYYKYAVYTFGGLFIITFLIIAAPFAMIFVAILAFVAAIFLIVANYFLFCGGDPAFGEKFKKLYIVTVTVGIVISIVAQLNPSFTVLATIIQNLAQILVFISIYKALKGFQLTANNSL
ncbi:hypothetical protein G7061_07395 [Erysipelothrix sp. HDW6B]|uniref:hypothetical protein n=1 Tax=Erysipelothrix sp. HDW6B TaxID=2714929 RepID=UPI00140A873B|nr:hypothetical protein [Erysipelothrix sp. HDW6B]QIK86442.1 hypothetical protein G7061_07395 [Erysipelothrix sp. HDW6B]